MAWYRASELEQLKLGEGQAFFGEASLAITKALFQSGIAYVTGYQGSPAANLLDTIAQAEDIRKELGIHVIAATSEAAAAATLGASINFPLRGVAIYKATAGTAVAADAINNLASAGVKGGTLIIVGGDYGEKGNTGQERTIALAMKSSLWLMEPRPEVATLVRMTEAAFELSEASNAPVMLEFRLRASHVTGGFIAKNNKKPAFARDLIDNDKSNYDRLVLPPSNYLHEREKIEKRLPAARAFIRERRLNEVFDGDCRDIGIITVGGLYNAVASGLRELGLADVFGQAKIPVYALNVTWPLVPEEIIDFCRSKRAILVVEESHPAYLEQALESLLRKAQISTDIVGKDVLPNAGQYTEAVVLKGIAKFIEGSVPKGVDLDDVIGRMKKIGGVASQPVWLKAPLPARDSTFCTGCPERPVISALKLAKREIGPVHISSDIGCHSFSVFPPFNMGNTILGYGLGLASSAAVGRAFGKRTIAVMGDGGFWHNGLLTGVAGGSFNDDDTVLLVLDNGYTASTGGQTLPSSGLVAPGKKSKLSIEAAVRALGVTWVRTLNAYSVATIRRTMVEAMKTKARGLKVIIARGECQLQVQQRTHAQTRSAIAGGERTVRTRFGVDDEICTGDHACIRLSGCPSLSVKANPDPLKVDPIAHVNQGCVGCGLCGEIAHAAVLCPSFHRAEIVHHPSSIDRAVAWLNRKLIGLFDRAAAEAM
ncbi:MAG: indolepyruvate ferredoxin oxidoreductase subunit alpha [Alphaproteobacteria bacterium]|nr:indolepyruvate ferredoxin oxidoreductase subunit alpha [Alphaproteobacteria bacterium]